MTSRLILAAALFAFGAAGVYAASTNDKAPGASGGDVHGHMHRGMEFSVERVAMHNIMAELMSAKTGRSQEEIRQLFESSANPHDAVEKLGLSHDDMRALFQQAHLTLIQKAQSAGLITADQAAKLKAAPLPDHHGGPRPDGEGPGPGGPHGDRGE